MNTIILFLIFVFFVLKFNSKLLVENIALRQQLAILKQTIKQPKIRTRDRVFWVLLFRFWKNWKDVLIFVKLATVIRWHRKGFKLFWKFKSRRKNAGRPKIDPEISKLIKDMAKANPLWGAPRIHGELLKLCIDSISKRTIFNIIINCRPKKPPSQTWRTFLKNHMHNTFAIDFFQVPTATFNVLFVFIILWHENRKIVHFNVTTNPTAKWAAQQIIEACPWEDAPKSPWQNPFVERIIGSIRRDCLDHVIVFGESHLKRILSSISQI